MNEEEILLNYLKDENWRYFHEDGVPYKIIFMQDRDILIKYITQLQNNWNELKKCIREWITYYSVCDVDYKELNVLLDVESKMQELEKGKDE